MKYSAFIIVLILLTFGCKEDQKKVEPITPKASASIRIQLMNGDDPMMVFDTISLSSTEDFQLSLFKLYLSEIQVLNDEAEATEVGEVYLFDPAVASLNEWNIEIPEGEYTGVSMGFGLSPILNDADPGSFPNEHPLSSYQSMYWSMLKYRFARIEGNYMSPDSMASVSYHPGTDELFERPTFNLSEPIEVDESRDYEVLISIDVPSLFNGQDYQIVLPEEAQSHSDSGDIHIARKLMKNLVAASSVQIVAIAE